MHPTVVIPVSERRDRTARTGESDPVRMQTVSHRQGIHRAMDRGQRGSREILWTIEVTNQMKAVRCLTAATA